MKRKLSIGFFTATLAAFIILAAAYHFTYERAVERARGARCGGPAPPPPPAPSGRPQHS